MSITVMAYLSDQESPEYGGVTRFTRLGKGFKAVKGDVVLWSSCRPDGSLDDLSEHQGEPIKRGTKTILNLFLTRSQIPAENCAHLSPKVPDKIEYVL